MNEKAKNVATGLVLYRTNYTYIAKNGQVRAGAIVVEAPNIETAKKVSEERLTSFGLAHHRITNTKEY